MRQPPVVVGLGAVTSGLLYLSFALDGSMPLFAYFVQLPLAFTGLALGASASAVAAAVAALLIFIADGWLAPVVFLIVYAVPIVLFAYYALLWRQNPDGTIEWYPIGWAAANLALFTLAVTAAGLVTVQLLVGDVERLLASGLHAALAALSGGELQASAPDPLPWLAFLPGLVTASWILMTLVNMFLAQRLAARSGMARRPIPPLAEFELPSSIRWFAAMGLLLTAVADGLLFTIAATVALSVCLLYALQGLAVIHSLFARRGWPPAALVVFYVVLLLAAWSLLLPIVLLGLADDLIKLRQRLI